MSEVKYSLDADGFIRSKQKHYAFDICPGFWDALLRAHGRGCVDSIVPVRRELLRGKDALAKWVKNQVPESFFESTESQDIQESCAEILQWVNDNKQYTHTGREEQIRRGCRPMAHCVREGEVPNARFI